MDDPILFWNDISNKANKFDHTAPMKGAAQGGPTRSSRGDRDGSFGDARRLFWRCRWPNALSGQRCAESLWRGHGPQISKRSRHDGGANGARGAVSRAGRDFDTAAKKITSINNTDQAAAEYGRRVALALLGLRASDRADSPPHVQKTPYVYSTGKPHHRADPLNLQPDPLGAFWRQVLPFAIQASHPLAPYPAFNSAKYNADHDEVLAKGGAASQPSTT